jgi:hypothetical protein
MSGFYDREYAIFEIAAQLQVGSECYVTVYIAVRVLFVCDLVWCENLNQKFYCSLEF